MNNLEIRTSYKFKYLKYSLFFSFLTIGILFNSNCSGQYQISQASLIKKLQHIKEENRADTALWYYLLNKNQEIKEIAKIEIDRFEKSAKDNKELYVRVFNMRSRYFDYSLGKNDYSIQFLKDGLAYAKENDIDLYEANYLHALGLYYQFYNDNPNACKYFLLADDILKRIGYGNVPNVFDYLNNYSNFFFNFKDDDEALVYANLALKFPPTAPRGLFNLLTLKGLIYENRGENNKALSTYRECLKDAESKKDSAWIAITKGNMGAVYAKLGNNKEALVNLAYDYNESIRVKEYSSAAGALIEIFKIKVKLNQLKDAENLVIPLTKLKDQLPRDLNNTISYFQNLSIFYEKSGNQKLAFVYLKAFELNIQKKIALENLAGSEKVKLDFEIQKHSIELKQLNAKYENKLLLRNSIIVIIILIIIIFILFFFKVKSEKKLQNEKNLLLENQLETSIAQVKDYTNLLKERNEMINVFRTEIERLKQGNNLETGKIDLLLNSNIMTEENWNNFRTLFTRAYPNFFKFQKEQYPALTSTDLKILSLIKLQLSNNEMADMLGITLDGVKKAKQRLKRKMDSKDFFTLENDLD